MTFEEFFAELALLGFTMGEVELLSRRPEDRGAIPPEVR